jgi:hypothetical protein
LRFPVVVFCVQDPEFVAKLGKLQSDPSSMAEVLQDPRIMEMLGAMMGGGGGDMGDAAAAATAQGGGDATDASAAAPASARAPEPEPEPEEELTEEELLRLELEKVKHERQTLMQSILSVKSQAGECRTRCPAGQTV